MLLIADLQQVGAWLQVSVDLQGGQVASYVEFLGHDTTAGKLVQGHIDLIAHQALELQVEHPLGRIGPYMDQALSKSDFVGNHRYVLAQGICPANTCHYEANGEVAFRGVGVRWIRGSACEAVTEIPCPGICAGALVCEGVLKAGASRGESEIGS